MYVRHVHSLYSYVEYCTVEIVDCSRYRMTFSIIKDRLLTLILPNKEVCMRCHDTHDMQVQSNTMGHSVVRLTTKTRDTRGRMRHM